jgi:hypothetical protein
MRQQALPARIQQRQHGQEHIAQVGQGHLRLVRHLDAFAAQRTRLPQQGDLPQDGVFHIVALRSLEMAVVAAAHQFGDAVAVIDHALAHHFGGMRREHGHDQCPVQQRRCRGAVHALAFQSLQGTGQVLSRIVQPPLPVLGEIRQHREQHETADKGQRVVEPQPHQTLAIAARPADAPEPVHRLGTDALDTLVDRGTAVGPDHITQQPAQVTDIGVLCDGAGRGDCCDSGGVHGPM